MASNPLARTRSVSVLLRPPSGPITSQTFPGESWAKCASPSLAPMSRTNPRASLPGGSRLPKSRASCRMGRTARPHCSQALTMMFCQCRLRFARTWSESRVTVRSVMTGCISLTPASTVFWMAKSMCVLLDTPSTRWVSRVDSFLAGTRSVIRTVTAFL